jgi:YidC/Oxa1 family membrane protein insertase
MDRKTVIVLIISFALMLLWPHLVNRIYPPRPLPRQTNLLAVATNQLAAGSNGLSPMLVPPGSNLPPTGACVPLVTSGEPEQLVVLENALARYTFSSHGGGLKLVELKRYPETVGCYRKGSTTNLASLNTAAAVPALALLGGEALQGDGVYTLSRSQDCVRAEKPLSNGLLVVKEFRLSSNYLLAVTVRLENRSGQALTLPPQLWEVGTATPMGPLDDASRLAVYWYNGAKREVSASEFSSTGFLCMPRTPPARIERGHNDILWASVHNQFFALAVLLPSNAPAAQLTVLKTNLPPPSPAVLEIAPRANRNPFGLRAVLTYPALKLEAGQAWERQFHVYAGPKEYQLLVEIAAAFGNELDLLMDYGGFFGFFAKLLLLSMNFLHDTLKLSYALAIIVITVLIKLLFWPLTQASTRSMKRMQQLQPQMKVIQEKYKDDPAKMNRKLMEFMKEHKVSPMAGCLPILIQLPVFFGFYKMILTAIELRGARFLWACDLTKPDTILYVLGFPINPLPLIMGATMLWQSYLTPTSPGMDPVQQRLMKYVMPLFFLGILYNFSAGLTLYWTVQNLLSIAQMKLTRAQEQAVAAKPAGPTKKK